MKRDAALPGSTRAIDEGEHAQHLKNMDVYGYTVVSQFMTADLVTLLKQHVDDAWNEVASRKYAGRPDRDQKDRLIYNLQGRHKVFIDILGDPFIEGICMAKLNDDYYRFIPADAPNYILNYYNARSSGEKLDLHIDSHIPNPGKHASAMQVVYLLDDMTESNGCTVVVPGSHRSGEYTDRGLANIVPVRAKAGDLVLWDSRLWHGTHENVAGTSRWALVATLTRWWMKQAMDIPRSLPQEIYAQLSDRQKALMGFCAIPPLDEKERINTKSGYDFLKPAVGDYF